MERSGSGVLFVATGAIHVAAARAAAASVRATNPGLKIAIFSDAADPGPEFDLAMLVEVPRARSKVDALYRTPFENTLYLDTDTRVRADLADMFRLLERFDLGVAQVTRAYKAAYRLRWRSDVPDAFPQHNAGVILYRAAPVVLDFMRDWQAAFDDAGFSGDQVTFRDLLWSSDLRFCVLPRTYNQRRYTPIDRFLSKAPAPVILHLNRYNPAKRRWIHRLFGPEG